MIDIFIEVNFLIYDVYVYFCNVYSLHQFTNKGNTNDLFRARVSYDWLLF